MLEHVSGGGAFFSRRTRKTRVRKNKAREETLPALAFVVPYNEMVMRGLLNVDGFQVKTRSSNWNYRGPVLLYTSHGRYHKVPAEAYNINPDDLPRGAIVGVATLVDSSLLTHKERFQMIRNFNNMDHDAVADIVLGRYEGKYIEPLPFGVFLRNVRRFKTPVSFKPKPGAVGIMRVPVRLVAKALKEVSVGT